MITTNARMGLWMVTLDFIVKRKIIASVGITVQMERHVLMVMVPTLATVFLVTLETIVRMKTTASPAITVQMEPYV